MDAEAEETAVIVVAGSWEFSDSGIWDFCIAKDCYAQTISMRMDMSYAELVANIKNEFELSELRLQPNISYWPPSALSIFSVNRRPLVIITTAMGLRSFLNIRRSAVNVNLLLSLEATSDTQCTTGLRKVCVGAQEPRNQLLHEGNQAAAVGNTGTGLASPDQPLWNPFNGENGGIRMYSIGSVSSGMSGENDDNAVSGVRRRLFAEACDKGKGVLIDEGGCSNKQMLHFSVGEGHSCGRGLTVRESSVEVLGTNCSGIIKLADASTPSLSIDRESQNDVRQDIDLVDSDFEDVLALREVEVIEKALEDLAKERGAECMDQSSPGATEVRPLNAENDSGNEDCDEGCEGYFTDGVDISDYEENEDCGLQSLDELFGDDNSEDVVVPIMEEGGPSAVGEPHCAEVLSSWFEEPGQGSGKDVGEEVLAYATNPINIPLSLQNSYEACNEQGTLPTTDAEPVFDDVIDLTNTDGCAPVSAEEDAIYIGRVFKDKEEMQNTISIYAIKRLFHFRQTRSDTERLVFVCVDPTCRWRVFGHVVSPNSKNFEVRTTTLTHTCTILTRAKYAKHASAKVIGAVLQRKYANGVRGPRAVDIPAFVLDELKVSVTYMKAWYSKEAAIRKSRGSDEESYKLLAAYMYLLKQSNPGSVYKLESKMGSAGVKQFKYLFFSLGASIAGIKHMRKVVLVDGTAIKAKFKGVLLAASMQNANMQVFPVGFGIVDSENIQAWTWFFRQLSLIVPNGEDLVIVFDRAKSIYAGIRTVYPLAFHGACAVHLERNVRHFSGKGLASLVSKAARAFNVGDFKYWYSEIATRSKKCVAYLDAIPLQHWTQAYCEAKRYNIMSSNIAEALNGALAKIVELPIVTMVESIRTKLMQWFCIRRAKAAKLQNQVDPVTPNVNKLMLRYHKASAGLAVIAVSDWTYQVSTPEGKSYYVDLEKKTCTCLQFRKLLIPCCHALAAARMNGVYIPSLVGSVYYVKVWGQLYEELILPVQNQGDALVPTAVEETRFNPPTNPAGPGRRRKRRIPSTGEQMVPKRRKSGPHKCYACLELGHNRATCSNPLG